MTGDPLTKDTMCYGHKSDMWMASEVRMLYRDTLNHEAIVTGARDRIIYLSQELHKSHIRLAKARLIIEDLKPIADHESLDTANAKEWLENKEELYSCKENDTKTSIGAMEHVKKCVQARFETTGEMSGTQLITLIDEIIKANS
jgi:hypothetical protein